MKEIKFIKDKGQCRIGYIGKYSDEEANNLIKKGFAKEYKRPNIVKIEKTKNQGDKK